MKDYWIYGVTFKMRSEIRKLGAYKCNNKKGKKVWRIDSLKKTHSSFMILEELGLDLYEVKEHL